MPKLVGPPPPLCNSSWALCCLLLHRSGSLPRSGRRLLSFLYCLLLRCPWGSDVAYALARGRPSVPCATALGRFAAYLSAVPGRSPAPCVLFLGCRATSCSCGSWGSVVAYDWARGRSSALCATARGHFAVAPPLSVAPLLCVLSFNVVVGPPALPRLRLRYRLSLGLWVLVRLLCAGLWALRCLVLCRSRSLVGSVRRASWWPCCRRPHNNVERQHKEQRSDREWRSYKQQSAHEQSHKGQRSAHGPRQGLQRSPTGTKAQGAVPRLRLRYRLSLGLWVLLRLLCGAALACALPLPVAPRLYAPCFLLAVLPPALVPVGLRCRPCLGPWALFCPLCDCACALRCLVALCSRALLRPVCCLAMLRCRLRL